eukprot:2450378-Alexandrium_andersonii.AAC.1
MESSAMVVLQNTAEQFVVEMLQEANFYKVHAGRKTLKPKDVVLAKRFFRLGSLASTPRPRDFEDAQDDAEEQ